MTDWQIKHLLRERGCDEGSRRRFAAWVEAVIERDRVVAKQPSPTARCYRFYGTPSKDKRLEAKLLSASLTSTEQQAEDDVRHIRALMAVGGWDVAHAWDGAGWRYWFLVRWL